MFLSWIAIIGWSLFLATFGIVVGIIGTTYYFKRFRKRALQLIDTYKDRARRAEAIIRTGQDSMKPGPIEKG